MQEVSAAWKRIVSGDYDAEMRLLVAGNEVSADNIFLLKKSLQLFPSSSPVAGGAVCGIFSTEFVYPAFSIPRTAEIVPQARVVNDQEVSEWIDKGHFFIDTREKNHQEGKDTILLQCYDAMRKAEQDFPLYSINFPATDLEIVQQIAGTLGVSIDPRTIAIMDKGYRLSYPPGYSIREVLGGIGAMYGGTWIMSDKGQLRLICIADIPAGTHYLVTEHGNPITIGGVRILV